MVSIKKYYYVETKTDEIRLTVEQFSGSVALPIVWNNRGQYRIIPVERVANKMELLLSMKHSDPIDQRPGMSKFFWEEAEEVDGKTIARLL